MIETKDMRQLEDLAFEIVKNIRVYARTDFKERRDNIFLNEIKIISNKINNWAENQEFKRQG